MTEKREKCGLALRPSLIAQCDRNLERAEVSSRNEFVEKAIEFYVDFLIQPEDKRRLKLQPWLEMEKNLQEMGTALSRNQYKIAVELAKIGCVLSSALELDSEAVSQIDEYCQQLIIHRKGTVRLQDLIDSNYKTEWKQRR